jgi:hypothetical protein
MQARKFKTSISICCLALACVWLNARLSKVEHKASRTNSFPGIEFASVTEPQMPGISVVFEEPGFLKLKATQLAEDNFPVLDGFFDLELEKLRRVVPLAELQQKPKPSGGGLIDFDHLDSP